MAHYAFLDMANVVTEVIVGRDEGDTNTNWELEYQDVRKQVCKRTSYNTAAGEHTKGGTPFRKNYAGIGYTYDYARDAFIPPQPYASWTLDSNKCIWEAPVEYPSDGKQYTWNEDTTSWNEIT
jgi:hypothetical protein